MGAEAYLTADAGILAALRRGEHRTGGYGMNGNRSREWLTPLLGVAFIVLLFISFFVQGNPKDASHPANEIAKWYSDNKNSAELGAFLGTVAAVLLIFFGAYL